MKKYMSLLILVCVALLVVGSVAPVAAKGGKGALKMDLVRTNPTDGKDVGWAIVNTTADGKLIVEVHLDDGEPSITFDQIRVFVTGETPATCEIFYNVLVTNAQGKGNAHVVRDISGLDLPDPLPVAVVILDFEAASPYIRYWTTWKSISLK